MPETDEPVVTEPSTLDGAPATTPEPSSDSTATPVASADGQTEASAPAEAAPAPPAPSPLFAGKYKTAEEAYWRTQGELEAIRNQTKPTPTTQAATPKYTTDQLWQLRAAKLQEMTAAQVGGESDRALTLAANINWIDNEIQQQQMSKLRGELSAQSVVQTLASEGAELLKPYQADLVPGTPLYEQAGTYFTMVKQAMDSGANIDNILSGLCALAAAAKTGKTTAGVEQAARAEFAGSLNKAMKQAVIAGAGKATKTPDSAPDFLSMTNKQFDDYQRKIGVKG